MILTQYPEGVLSTWKTSRLGTLYINSYLVSRDEPEELGQLEMILKILRKRPLNERAKLLEGFVNLESEKVDELLLHYVKNVF